MISTGNSNFEFLDNFSIFLAKLKFVSSIYEKIRIPSGSRIKNGPRTCIPLILAKIFGILKFVIAFVSTGKWSAKQH